MSEDTLKALHEAVNALNKTESLAILNIDEDRFNRPETTLEYRARCRAWSRLKNIAKSVPDLLRQPDNLALVGFLGHFSSGKSSLINALLRVAGSQDQEYEREVNQHPTDTRITLITHPDHAHLVKSSAYTALNAIDVEQGPALDFLRHATLVDTPGLGNDEAEHETVSRFLHLCHVLVITISARVPFADKDKDFELLDTAFNKLEGVPKILVITSAEEFLTSRDGSFQSDWQTHQADAFWTEAILRLRSDPRFQNQLSKFEQTQRFFVDSKEPFRVDEVRDAILPIAMDDRERLRIRYAQSRYVLTTAADALDVLLQYISVRSANLRRLRDEAQKRAANTEVAVEEVLQSLERSFEGTRQRLREASRSAPTGTSTIDAITPQVLDETGREALANLEQQIARTLTENLRERRRLIWRSVQSLFRARTRGRWPGQSEEEGGLLSFLQSPFNLSGDMPRLEAASEACTQSVRRLANQHLASAVARCGQHLIGAAEAQAIGNCTYEIESALSRSERKLDHSIRGFYAYVTAPDSLELLHELGFVEFDQSGKHIGQRESLKALELPAFVSVEQTSETCKRALRAMSPQQDADLAQDLEEAETLAAGLEDSSFTLGEDYTESLARHIESLGSRAFGEFAGDLSQYLSGLVEPIDDAARGVEDATRRVRSAGWRVLKAVTLVGFVGLAAGGTVYFLDAGVFSRFLDVAGRYGQVVLPLAAAAVIASVAWYLWVGPGREDLRPALKTTLVDRLSLYRKRKSLESSLTEYFDEAYDRLVSGVVDMPLGLDEAVVGRIARRIKGQPEYVNAERTFARTKKTIEARKRLLDKYINAVHERLADMPNELQDRASDIKKSAVEEHLERIEVAAEAVEDVEKDVRRIADIATPPH